nr:hypothetical protein [Schwartzia sp. (in: firmicutes)]
MPNYCDYNLRATGSEEGLDALQRVFENSVAKDGVGEQFVRVFEANMRREKGVLHVNGCCAWSVWSAMFDETSEPVGDCRWIALPEFCARYGVTVEVFGSELGLMFAEHYLVDGACRVEEHEAELVPYPEDENEWCDFDPTDGVVFNTARGDLAFGEFTI